MTADPIALAYERAVSRSHAQRNVDVELLPLPCLMFDGATNTNGYGVIAVGGRAGRLWLVHRLTWVRHFGVPSPETPYVLHHCDVPACFEPTHLFLGTHLDNMADMRVKGRAQRPLGEKSPTVKLTADVVRSMRERAANGDTARAIANDCGVTRRQVYRIIQRQSWAHVT